MYRQIKLEDEQQVPVQNNFNNYPHDHHNHHQNGNNDNVSNTIANGNFIHLFEKFCLTYNRHSYGIDVELTNKGICMRRHEAPTSDKSINRQKQIDEEILQYADVIGVRCSSTYQPSVGAESGFIGCRHQSVAAIREDKSSGVYMSVCAYVKQLQPLRRVRTERVFCINNQTTKELNMRTAQLWQQAIMNNTQRSKSALPVLILLNPKSGAGKARELFQQHMLPVLNDANLPYELLITTRENYARELLRMRKNILQEYRGVIVASGDGLFYEVLNGIMARDDWQSVCANLPLGIVPCGSGNGLASSISYLYNEPTSDQRAATFNCLSGHSTAMDIVRVELLNHEVIYSFLSLGWGIIADVDIESEALRVLGAYRFTLWTLHRMIRLRTYKGRISYLPYAKHKNNQLDLYYDALEHTTNTTTTTTKVINNNSDDYNNQSTNVGNTELMPPLGTPLVYSENGWQSEVNDFVLVHAAYTTHLSADAFFSPQSRINDGIIYLVLIRAGIGRKELLNLFLRLSNGTHLPSEQDEHNKYISVIPVTAFRLEPLCNEGLIAIDGERVPYGPVQAEIMPGAIKVMVPPLSTTK